jgi:hypothetical protein
LLEASAWSAALSVVVFQTSPDIAEYTEKIRKVGGGDLFEAALASVSSEPGAFEKLVGAWTAEGVFSASEVKQARELVTSVQKSESSATSDGSPLNSLVHQLYIRTSSVVMAVIFGHELSHYYANACPVTTPAYVESIGLINEARAADGGGSTSLCDMEISPHELVADTCALRFLHRMADEPGVGLSAGSSRIEHRLLNETLRSALHIVTWMLAYGPRSKGRSDFFDDQERPRSLSHTVLRGYLTPARRLFLFASELSAPSFAVPIICEDSARVLVLLARSASAVCRRGDVTAVRQDERILARQFMKVVPSGVVAVWNTGTWDQERSFLCE